MSSVWTLNGAEIVILNGKNFSFIFIFVYLFLSFLLSSWLIAMYSNEKENKSTEIENGKKKKIIKITEKQYKPNWL